MRFTHKRGLAAAAVVTVGALLLAGCGRTDDPTTPSAGPVEIDDSPATGEIRIWSLPGEGAAIEAVVDDFVAENPDAKVVITPVATDELPRKLDTAIASGQVPDIIQPSTGLQSYVAADAIAPVPTGVFNDDDFFEAAIAASTFDGVQYAVPWYVTVQALYYRTDFVAEAGADIPTTWDDAVVFAQDLVDSGVRTGFFQPPSGVPAWQLLLAYIYQAGGEFVSDGEFTLDTPEVVEALTYFHSYFEKGLTDPAFIPSAPGETEAKFADGSIGSFVSGSFSYQTAVEALGNDASLVGVAPLPAGPDTGAGYLGGSGLAVMADSDNTDGAWKFLRWFSANEEAKNATYDIAGVLPAARSAWETSSLAESPAAPVFMEQLEVSKPIPAVTTWTEVRSLLSTYSEQIARGVITPEEAAAALQKEATAIGTGD